MIKYLVQPETMASAYDDDEHYVGASALIALYDVSRRECIIDSHNALNERQRKRYEEDFIVLRPLFNGQYQTWLKDNIEIQKRKKK